MLEGESFGREALYNDYVRKVKEDVGGGKLWLEVVEGDLGLLVGGGVSQEEAHAFLMPKEENGGAGNGALEDEDDEDLLDML